MSSYSPELKAALLSKLLPPQNMSVVAVALSRQEGIPEATLYAWRTKLKAGGAVVPGDKKQADNWPAENKLAAVLHAASLSEIELSEYCRSKGLYSEQISAWRQACISRSTVDPITAQGRARTSACRQVSGIAFGQRRADEISDAAEQTVRPRYRTQSRCFEPCNTAHNGPRIALKVWTPHAVGCETLCAGTTTNTGITASALSPRRRGMSLDQQLLIKRHALYQPARNEHPHRWSGATRNWQPIGAVTLNPDREQPALKIAA